MAMQKFPEVIFAAAADAVEEEHIGPLAAEVVFVGGAFDDVLQPVGEEPYGLLCDQLMGDGGWHSILLMV